MLRYCIKRSVLEGAALQKIIEELEQEWSAHTPQGLSGGALRACYEAHKKAGDF